MVRLMGHSSPFRAKPDPSQSIDAADLRERLYAILRQLDRSAAGEGAGARDDLTARRVIAILRARRLRTKFFDPDLFADPAWDILLELYAAELSQIRVPIGNLAISAAVPATTGIRWINILERKGLVRRADDPLDARRTFIELTPHASEKMSELLSACPPNEPFF
jgi:DNA-binding MarR family transcriptional regulator